jgi:hypothetical protein
MATIEQVQRGFTRFVDMHVSGAFDGWQRAVVAGSAGLLAANFPQLVKTYGGHPIVSALGVYDPMTGNIDIDSLYNAFIPQLGADKIPVSIPKVGTIKLGREEFDALLRYIKEA